MFDHKLAIENNRGASQHITNVLLVCLACICSFGAWLHLLTLLYMDLIWWNRLRCHVRGSQLIYLLYYSLRSTIFVHGLGTKRSTILVLLFIEDIKDVVTAVVSSLPLIKCSNRNEVAELLLLVGVWMVISHWFSLKTCTSFIMHSLFDIVPMFFFEK